MSAFVFVCLRVCGVSVWVWICVCYSCTCAYKYECTYSTLYFKFKLGESIDTGFHADIFAANRCACLCVCVSNIYLVTALFTIRSHSLAKHTARTHSIPGAQTYTISEHTKHTYNPSIPMNSSRPNLVRSSAPKNVEPYPHIESRLCELLPVSYLIHNFQCARYVYNNALLPEICYLYTIYTA